MQPQHDVNTPGVSGSIRNGLSDLHAYALCLDAELERVSERIDALDDGIGAPGESDALRARRRQIADELDLISQTIAALRRDADPHGRYL